MKKNLNPTWNQAFEWKGYRADIFSSDLEVVVMDKDPMFDSNDPLGSVKLPLAQFANEVTPQELTLKLDTQGYVTVEIA